MMAPRRKPDAGLWELKLKMAACEPANDHSEKLLAPGHQFRFHQRQSRKQNVDGIGCGSQVRHAEEEERWAFRRPEARESLQNRNPLRSNPILIFMAQPALAATCADLSSLAHLHTWQLRAGKSRNSA